MNIVNTENVEHYKWGKDSDGWHLLNTEELSIIEELVPAGESEERHFHNKSNQFFYVLSGVATIEVFGKSYEIKSGSGFFVKAKELHQLFNKTDSNLRFLVISQPKSHGDRENA
jgi:mannose-6-phosphate isomerase-like protein (cupin superfamily)